MSEPDRDGLTLGDTESDGFAARHAVLARGYGFADDPVDPNAVLAMPIVLHLPKQDPPRRSAVLEAAAAATVALCLDARVGEGGPWHDAFIAWTDARIRKVARRARGAQWDAVSALDGVGVDVDGAQARALVPGPVGVLDRRIKRLQIGGTDLEHDDPGPPDPGLPVLWVNSSLDMTLGKAAAQVGHAAMLLAGAMTVDEAHAWAQAGFRSAVRKASLNQWITLQQIVARGMAVAVRDAGFTEVAPGSVTVIAVPDLGR